MAGYDPPESWDDTGIPLSEYVPPRDWSALDIQLEEATGDQQTVSFTVTIQDADAATAVPTISLAPVVAPADTDRLATGLETAIAPRPTVADSDDASVGVALTVGITPRLSDSDALVAALDRLTTFSPQIRDTDRLAIATDTALALALTAVDTDTVTTALALAQTGQAQTGGVGVPRYRQTTGEQVGQARLQATVRAPILHAERRHRQARVSVRHESEGERLLAVPRRSYGRSTAHVRVPLVLLASQSDPVVAPVTQTSERQVTTDVPVRVGQTISIDTDWSEDAVRQLVYALTAE